MTIKVLMVDVDGVIVVHPRPEGWSVDLGRDLGLRREVLQERFFKPHFADIVSGRAPLRKRLAPVLREIAPRLTCDQLIDHWFQNDAHLDADLLAQIAAIRRRGIVAHLATVQEHERADYLWQTVGLSAKFDAMHYAADLGWAKPAAQFFAEVERRSGFRADEIFFIDDKLENVEAARRRGWRAEVWTGKRFLEQMLKAVDDGA